MIKNMRMKMMTGVSVRPWREKQVINDLVAMCEASATTHVAVMYLCHPEGLPLMKKNEEAAEQFHRVKSRLASIGVKAGVLIQTLVDHSERFQPLSPVSFQRITGFDGTVVRSCFCPLDKDFLNYTREMVALFSRTQPDFLLLDDDIRLDSHAPTRWSCACPLHVEFFNQYTGRHDSREELFEAMKRDDETGLTVRRAWQESGRESMLALFRTIREAIDSVDPSLRCGKCVTGARDLLYLESIARTVAGKTTPFLRLAGACYMLRGYDKYAGVMTHILAQKSTLSDDIEVLCEGDCYIHTRYHTPLKSLRGFIAGTCLIAGIDTPYTFITGLVEWIASDVEGYSRMLKSSVPFFSECKKVNEKTRWLGPTIVHTGKWRINRPWDEAEMEHESFREWGEGVCGRMGIPFVVNNFESPVCMINGMQAVYDLSDEELKKIFAKGVMLDGVAALNLYQRGYGELMGVEVAEGDEDLRYFFEKFSEDEELNGSAVGKYSYAVRNKAQRMKWLKPLDNATRVVSSLVSAPWSDSLDQHIVAPAGTAYENKLGGRVVVYAHEVTSGTIAIPAAFLSDIRKEQLTKVLAWLSRQPVPAVAYTGVDTYFQYGYDEDVGEHVAAVFNVSQDDIEPLSIRFGFGKPSGVRKLTDEGRWEAVTFNYKEGMTELDICVQTMKPLVLRVERSQS